MTNFFLFAFAFVCAGFLITILEDSLMYRVFQFKEISYEPSSHYFAEKPEREGYAFQGVHGWIERPSFYLALHELMHVRGYGELAAYSVQAVIMTFYIAIFGIMFYVASETGDDIL